MVELMDDLEMDMPKWVEEMMEVPVEIVDWAMCPTA
jgi:predicted lipid carrier protein YhbT